MCHIFFRKKEKSQLDWALAHFMLFKKGFSREIDVNNIPLPFSKGELEITKMAQNNI